MNRYLLLLLVAAVAAVPALAQSSASFKVAESTFNAGGRPDDGALAQSTSFRVTLDAIGEAFVTTRSSSASFVAQGGWARIYGAPGEVRDLRFTASDALDWTGDPAAASYNLYRDTLANLSGSGFGSCEQSGVPASRTTDATSPPVGDGLFYLVTSVNRLEEEGTKGYTSDGSRREGTVCP